MTAALAKSWTSILVSLVLSAGLLTGCQEPKQLDSQFVAGREALMRGAYRQSIQELQTYLSRQPEGRLASRASFLIAKAHLGIGAYEEARLQFEHTIRNYPASEEAHKAQYKLALLSLLQGDDQRARMQFAELIETPSGTLVPEAAAMLRYLEKQAQGVPEGED